MGHLCLPVADIKKALVQALEDPDLPLESCAWLENRKLKEAQKQKLKRSQPQYSKKKKLKVSINEFC